MKLVFFLVCLNFMYKLFVRKHVSEIILRIIAHFVESDVAAGNVLDDSPMYGTVRSHILKVPRNEAKPLREIISTSTTRDCVIKSINKMLNPKVASMLYSQAVVRDAEKDVETLDEDVASSDEGIFLGCSINSMSVCNV